MPVHPLVAALANAKGFPSRDIAACRARRDEAIPVFLGILKQAVEGDLLLEWEEGEALFLIIHLLGEFEERAAFAPLTMLLHSDPEYVEDILGDAITATIPGVLIRTFDGNHGALEGIIEAPLLDEYVRSAAFDAWVYLAVEGRIDRDHAHAFIRACASRLQPRDGCFVWVTWMDAVAYLGLTDLHDEVRQACADGRIDPTHTLFRDFETLVAEVAASDTLTGLLERHGVHPFTDAIAEFSKWSGFSEQDRRDRRREDIEARMADMVINPHRHVGRNDPCPCGSGKKFKKCCGG